MNCFSRVSDKTGKIEVFWKKSPEDCAHTGLIKLLFWGTWPISKKWKSWLKTQHSENRSWQIRGETIEIVGDFIFWGSKITANGGCSHEIKRHLLLGRKAMTNLDSILKSRDITLPTKVHLVKAIVFLVVMYGCESWTIQKAESWRTDAFELWC